MVLGSPYTPYSIHLRGTIEDRVVGFRILGSKGVRLRELQEGNLGHPKRQNYDPVSTLWGCYCRGWVYQYH